MTSCDEAYGSETTLKEDHEGREPMQRTYTVRKPAARVMEKAEVGKEQPHCQNIGKRLHKKRNQQGVSSTDLTD